MTEQELRKTKPESLFEMDDESVLAYVKEAGPLYLSLMADAEKIMEKARPLNEGLYIGRGILVDRGIELPR